MIYSLSNPQEEVLLKSFKTSAIRRTSFPKNTLICFSSFFYISLVREIYLRRMFPFREFEILRGTECVHRFWPDSRVSSDDIIVAQRYHRISELSKSSDTPVVWKGNYFAYQQAALTGFLSSLSQKDLPDLSTDLLVARIHYWREFRECSWFTQDI